jgi:hypothetical protein
MPIYTTLIGWQEVGYGRSEDDGAMEEQGKGGPNDAFTPVGSSSPRFFSHRLRRGRGRRFFHLFALFWNYNRGGNNPDERQ